MTHDTLCPWRVAEESDSALRFLAGAAVCECYLIAKVREDALAAAVQRVESLVESRTASVEWTRDYEADETGNTRNPRVWLREATAAIKGDQE